MAVLSGEALAQLMHVVTCCWRGLYMATQLLERSSKLADCALHLRFHHLEA
jgi:hypothetical protein